MIYPIVGGALFSFIFVKVLYSIIDNKFSILFGGKWLQELSSLWFLWSVLSSSLVLCILIKYGKNIYFELIIIFLGFLFVSMFPNPHNNIYMYPYYVIGYYFNKYETNINRFKYIGYISFIIYPILLIFFTKKHYIYTSGIIGKSYSILDYFFIDLFRWGIGFIGCIFILIILRRAIRIEALNKICDLLAKFGKKSLEIYIISMVFLSAYLPQIVILIRKTKMINFLDMIINNTLIYNFLLTPIIAILYYKRIGKDKSK